MCVCVHAHTHTSVWWLFVMTCSSNVCLQHTHNTTQTQHSTNTTQNITAQHNATLTTTTQHNTSPPHARTHAHTRKQNRKYSFCSLPNCNAIRCADIILPPSPSAASPPCPLTAVPHAGPGVPRPQPPVAPAALRQRRPPRALRLGPAAVPAGPPAGDAQHEALLPLHRGWRPGPRGGMGGETPYLKSVRVRTF